MRAAQTETRRKGFGGKTGLRHLALCSPHEFQVLDAFVAVHHARRVAHVDIEATILVPLASALVGRVIALDLGGSKVEGDSLTFTLRTATVLTYAELDDA